jgi:hypothetical protein
MIGRRKKIIPIFFSAAEKKIHLVFHLLYKYKSFKNIRKQEPFLADSFTRSHIPQNFVAAVKMFFGEAKDIYRLWGKTMLAYRTSRLDTSLEEIVLIVLQSFRETIE